MGVVVIHNSRRSIMIFVLSYALIVACGLWISGLAVFDVLHGLLFLLLLIPFAVWQWLDRRPQIVLDDSGIGGVRVPGRYIAWADIQAAYLKPLGKLEHLWLEMSSLQRSAHTSLSAIPVRVNHLEVSSEALLDLVRQQLRGQTLEKRHGA